MLKRNKVKVIIERVGVLQDLPKKGSKDAAGYDLCADLLHSGATITGFPLHYSDRYKTGYVIVKPNTTLLIKSNFRMQLPVGYVAMAVPRSGLSLKHSITLGNSPGIIDADYRGDVGMIVRNESKKDFTIRHGERIAQMVILRLPKIELVLGTIDNTKRGEGGFGSTGK